MKRRRVLTLDSFSGLNNSAKTRMLPQYFRDGKNFSITDAKHVEKAWGSRKAYAGHNLTNIVSLFAHDQNRIILLAVGDGKLKLYDGTWSELGSSMMGNVSDVWFTSYLENPYIFYAGKAYYYDLATATLTDLNAANLTWWTTNGGAVVDYIPVIGHSPVIHNNALWIAGKDDFKNIVFYTRPFSVYFADIGQGALPYTQWVSVGGDDSASGSTYDEITGMAEIGADILVLKRKSIHRLVGASSVQYRAIQVNNSVGCNYPMSIQQTKMGAIWLESKTAGFWLYDGTLKNISRPYVDDILGTIKEDYVVRSGVYKDRYYYLTWDSASLVYDMDLESWSYFNVGYGAMTGVKMNGSTLASANIYSAATTTVVDPARPSEVQTVLQKTPVSAHIVELGNGFANLMESDGTVGSGVAFEITTPFFDMGMPQYQKVFTEASIRYKCADPVLTIDAMVDARTYEGITCTSEAGARFDRSLYDSSFFEDAPVYESRAFLPWEALGTALSLRIKASHKLPLRIESIVIYYTGVGIKEDKE